MGLDNPQTAKEKLQVAHGIMECGQSILDHPACAITTGVTEGYADWTARNVHSAAASMLLDGLSVHEVTMAECELDDEAVEQW